MSMNDSQQQEPVSVWLAGKVRSRETTDAWQRRLSELESLVEAAGGVVVGQTIQQQSDVKSASYLGKGKLEELRMSLPSGVSLVVVDADLAPSQIRNMESALSCRVLDRTQLILDIFALRAKSRVGRLQVERALLEYQLPRLTGRGVEMSRLGGGIGTRGPGETKLETDRRRIREKIQTLDAELRVATKTRELQRARRTSSIPTVALVGYTNAGKTTLLRRWSAERGAGVPVPEGRNRLFDTLDPLARRVKAGVASELVLLDTVGFIRNLPHLLVEAFHSTLEEVASADVIVQVVDASYELDLQLRTTSQVLREVGVADVPFITFYNKLDLVSSPPAPDVAATATVSGSALSGIGLDDLYRAVERVLRLTPVRLTLSPSVQKLPFWRDVLSHGRVMNTVCDENGEVQLVVETDERYAERLQPYVTNMHE
ncbi:GTPase HflX [Alicyclobacillus sp. SP_1]|uniref:GTPase HflX n=1 Tax=Alicyclobacillus sp. SP_1 TaxID=2942475 RepID=UPI002158362F|nr:GTPase HflX [Alicyclobacillus sp. SP_1]